MAVDTPHGLIASGRSQGVETRNLFTYEASKEDRVVTRLFAFESDEHKVRIAAEIFPFTLHGSNEPQWLFYDFPTLDQARRFADEALVALEFLGCTVDEPVGG